MAEKNVDDRDSVVFYGMLNCGVSSNLQFSVGTALQQGPHSLQVTMPYCYDKHPRSKYRAWG